MTGLLLVALLASESRVYALGGGGSAGAQQAGALYALLQHQRHLERLKQHPSRKGEIADLDGWPEAAPPSFATSSIGSMNGVLGALMWCSDKDTRFNAEDNPLWNAWKQLSWERLFPGEQSCADYNHRFPGSGLSCSAASGAAYGPRDGLFTEAAFTSIRQGIVNQLFDSHSFGEACQVPFAIALSAENPKQLPLVDHLATMRRMVFARLSNHAWQDKGGEEKKAMHVERMKPEAASRKEYDPLSIELQLPTSEVAHPDKNEEISISAFLDAVLASAAEPFVLLPRAVAYCSDSCPGVEAKGVNCPAGLHACSGRFFDGGVLDNLPIAGAVALAGIRGKPLDVLLLDSLRRSKVDDEYPDGLHCKQKPIGPAASGARGFSYYASVLDNFVHVGRGYELQTLARYGQLSERRTGRRSDQSLLESVDRHHRLVSEEPFFYFSPTLSFVDADFRQVDFDLGIYDGLRSIASHGCFQDAPNARSRGRLCDRSIASDWETFMSQFRAVNLAVNPNPSPVLQYLLLSSLADDEERDEASLHAKDDCTAAAKSMPGSAALSARRRASASGLRTEAAAQLRAALAATPAERKRMVRVVLILNALRSAERRAEDPSRPDDELGSFIEDLREPVMVGGVAMKFDPDDELPYLRNHAYWKADQYRLGFMRARAVERGDGSFWATPFGFGEMLMASSAAANADRWVLGGGSIPDKVMDSELASAVERVFLPSRLILHRIPVLSVIDAGNDRGLEFGWTLGSYARHFERPDSSLDSTFRLTLGADARWLFLNAPDRHWLFGPSAALSFQLADYPYLENETGLRLHWAWGPGHFQEPGAGSGNAWSLDFYHLIVLQALFNRPVEAGVQVEPGSFHLFLGVSDLNGTAYWLLRSFFGGPPPTPEDRPGGAP